MGELAGMARDPFPGQGFALPGCRPAAFVQPAVAFDLAHLLAHPRTEQGLLIGKGNADAVAVFAFATPRYIARIAGREAQCRDVHFDGSALAPGARAIACDAAQADSVQPLAGNAGKGALGYFDSDIIRVRKETTHAHGLRAPSS